MSEIKSQMQELITAVKESTTATKENVIATQAVDISIKGLKTEQNTLMKWLIAAVVILGLGETGKEITKFILTRELSAMAEVKK